MFCRYASSLIKCQRFGDSSIAWIGVAVDISKSLPVGVNDLEARVYRFNGPWCWERPIWQDFIRHRTAADENATIGFADFVSRCRRGLFRLFWGDFVSASTLPRQPSLSPLRLDVALYLRTAPDVGSVAFVRGCELRTNHQLRPCAEEPAALWQSCRASILSACGAGLGRSPVGGCAAWLALLQPDFKN
jgi:hypothetical protein